MKGVRPGGGAAPEAARRVAALAAKAITGELRRRGISGTFGDERAINEMARRLGAHPDDIEHHPDGARPAQFLVESCVIDVARDLSEIARAVTSSIMQVVTEQAVANGFPFSDQDGLRSAVFAGAARYLTDEIERRLTEPK